MSQEKVDKYKAEKANREQIIKKQKRIRFIEKAAAAVVGIAIVGWIGYSVYGIATRPVEGEKKVIEMDMDSVTEYLQSLDQVEE